MVRPTWKLENDIACFERKDTRPRRYCLYELLTEMREHLAYGKNGGVTNLELFEGEAIHIAQGISLFAKNNPHTADTRVENNTTGHVAPNNNGEELPNILNRMLLIKIRNASAAIADLEEKFRTAIDDHDRQLIGTVLEAHSEYFNNLINILKTDAFDKLNKVIETQVYSNRT